MKINEIQQKEQKVDYQDKWLVIIGVPVMNLLYYYLTFPVIRIDSQFFLIYPIDTLQVYLAWYSCRAMILYLDHYFPWKKNIIKRMLIQAPLVFITLRAMIIFFTEVMNNFLPFDKPVATLFYTFDIHIFLIWGFFINVLYLSLYLYNKLTLPIENA